jgi:hypothetical protein
MNLQEMFMRGIIGTDALYMCHYYELLTESKIMEHYLMYGTFADFRGCHVHANEELLAFCKKQNNMSEEADEDLPYQVECLTPASPTDVIIYGLDSTPSVNLISLHPKNIIQQERIHKLSQLIISEYEEERLNYAIKGCLASLSVRAQNAFSNALGHSVTYANILQHIFLNPDFDFHKIRNVGSKTIPELEAFVEWVYNAAINHNPMDHYEPINQKDILENLSYFDKLEVVLNDHCIGSTELRQNIAKSLNIFQCDADYPADTLTELFPYSKERIRQLRLSLNNRIVQQIIATRSVQVDFLSEYGLDISDDVVIITDDFKDLVNTRHNKDYTTRLISLMIGSYISSTHRFPGDYMDILTKRTQRMLVRYEWKSIPWIHEDLLNVFSLDSVMTELAKILATQRDSETVFSAHAYFKQNDVFGNPQLLARVRSMLTKILSAELGLSLQEDFTIILSPNKRMQHWRYVEAALQDLGTATSVEDIVARIALLWPNYPLTEHQVQVAISSNRDKFVNRYRSGLFMLPHFEEAQTVVNMSIRDMAYEYLCQQDAPISVDALLAYLIEFYPTTSKESVRNNLYEDKQDRFVFFPGACIGVKEKHEHLLSVLR